MASIICIPLLFGFWNCKQHSKMAANLEERQVFQTHNRGRRLVYLRGLLLTGNIFSHQSFPPFFRLGRRSPSVAETEPALLLNLFITVHYVQASVKCAAKTNYAFGKDCLRFELNVSQTEEWKYKLNHCIPKCIKKVLEIQILYLQ